MARVDYTGAPTTAPPIDQPDAAIRTQASPGAFGAQVGEGLEDVGQSGLKLTQFYGQIAADDAFNSVNQQVSAVLRGDPTKGPLKDANGNPVLGPGGGPVYDGGYFAMQGADALNARQDVAEHINSIIQGAREQLQTPASQHQFDTIARRYQVEYTNQMQEHSTQAYKQWMQSTAAAQGQNALRNAADNPDNPAIQQAAETNYINSEVNRYTAQYGSAGAPGSDVYDGLVAKAKGDFAVARIDAFGDDGARAQQVLDQYKDTLRTRPDYPQIVARVDERVFNQQAYGGSQQLAADALAQAQTAVHAPAGAVLSAPDPNNIGNVKNASGGFAQAVTPVDGVVLAANTLRSGYQGLTLEQIARKWAPASDHNDPAAWAANVSRASGIAVNAVPNLNDPKVLSSMLHGIGAAEKSQHDLAVFTPQVIDQGVAASLAGQHANLLPGGAGGNSTADNLERNAPQLRAQAESYAAKAFPDRPDQQARFVEMTMNANARNATMQNAIDTANFHTVQAGLAPRQEGGLPPASMDELRANLPDGGAALDALPPHYVAEISRTMFPANARGMAATYGVQSTDYLMNRVLAPASDPRRIKNPADLWSAVGVGKDAPLTNSGVRAFAPLLALQGTPQGEATLAALRSVMNFAHQNITASDPRTGVVDGKGDAEYDKFVIDTLDTFQAETKAGVPPSQMFDPENPNYVGRAMGSYTPPPGTLVQRAQSSGNTFGAKEPNAVWLASVQAARTSGALSEDQAARIEGTLRRQANGLITDRQAAAEVHQIAPGWTATKQ